MKILVRIGDHIQRAGGSFWTRKAYVDENPETVKKFIRAIARGVMFYRDNKAGSIPSLKEHLGVPTTRTPASSGRRPTTRSAPSFPPNSSAKYSNRGAIDMIAAKQWAPDKPLPDPEQFLVRSLLDPTLKQMNYVPTKLDALMR